MVSGRRSHRATECRSPGLHVSFYPQRHEGPGGRGDSKSHSPPMGLLGLGRSPRLSAQHFPRPQGLAPQRPAYRTGFWVVLVSTQAGLPVGGPPRASNHPGNCPLPRHPNLPSLPQCLADSRLSRRPPPPAHVLKAPGEDLLAPRQGLVGQVQAPAPGAPVPWGNHKYLGIHCVKRPQASSSECQGHGAACSAGGREQRPVELLRDEEDYQSVNC